MHSKNTKTQTRGQTGLYELRKHTDNIKTVRITFPLNLQTITIAFDVVKWRRNRVRATVRIMFKVMV